MNRKLALLLLMFLPYTIFAQHESIVDRNDVSQPENGMALFVGNTIITNSKFNLPTIGLEYSRELNHHFAIGLISEVELGSHIIQKNETGNIIAEVEREGAILVLPAVYIKVVENLLLYGGYGVEFEKNENIGLLKVGLQYKLRLKNENWVVLPNVSWDHTHLFDGIVYGVNFGYLF